ncbi:Nn.00g054130.m01.CDS01 [Neocucurbitaria sp. VM-36]
MKNIYVIGPQCTGKTTLVNALELDFTPATEGNCKIFVQKPDITREVARTVLKEKGFTRDEFATSPARALQLQKYIIEAQYDVETARSTTSPPSWYICDRSGLDPIVYAHLLVGPEAAARMLGTEIWLDLERRMKEGIVFLCEAGCQWLIDDGTRLMPTDSTDWMRVDDTFRKLLETRGISYSVVSKDMVDLRQRVEFVRRIVDES